MANVIELAVPDAKRKIKSSVTTLRAQALKKQSWLQCSGTGLVKDHVKFCILNFTLAKCAGAFQRAP